MAEMTISGTDVRVIGGIYLSLLSGYYGPARVRGSDTIIPSLAGRIPRIRVSDTRQIILDGDVLGASAAAFATNQFVLSALIDPVNLVTIVLGDGYLGASGASIECRALNWITSDLREDVQWQHWNIEYESVTPDWS